MNIITDSYYAKGESHMYCQDYALHGDKFLIISDGCSSSLNTDIGSRLLCHCTKNNITKPYAIRNLTTILTANKIIETMNIDQSCLDATLITALVDKNKIKVCIYGDGNIILINKSGRSKMFTFSYQQNVPNYLSYQLSYERMSQYNLINNNHKTIKMIEDHNNNNCEMSILSKEPTDLVFDISETKAILIASDGINNFFDKNKGELLQDKKVLNKITDIKSYVGKWIKRKTIRLINDMKKENIIPIDDIAIGGIYIE